MLAQQSDELGKDDVVASHRLRLLLFYAPDDIAHVVEHCQQQGLHQTSAVVVLLVAHFPTDGIEVIAIHLYLARGKRHDGVLHGEE